MTRMVSLLRGVNVGGRNRVPMPVLAELHGALGCRDVRTVLNSGNVVYFSTTPARALRPQLESALELRFGFPIDVFIRSAAQLREAVDEVPREFAVADERLVIIHFLSTPAAAIEWTGAERIHPRGDRVYVFYPNGQGRSRLSIEKLAGVRATGRNLRTVKALADLTAGG